MGTLAEAIRQQAYTIYPIIQPADYPSLKTINFYLIQREGGLALIDAGVDSDSCMGRLEDTLKQAGADIRDLDAILLTHHHEDHAGLVPRLLEIKDIPVYAHRDAVPRLKMDRNFLEMRLEFFRRLYREMGCGEMGAERFARLEQTLRKAPQHALQAEINEIGEGDQIFGFEVIETPGHSPDSITFLDAAGRTAFTGDVLISGSSVNAIIDPTPNGSRLPSVSQQRRSLERLAGLGADILYTGHHEPIRIITGLVSDRISRMERKCEKLLKLIGSGISVPARITEAYYRDLYRTQFPLVMSEIIGHLDYLEEQGKVTKTMSDGVWHYQNA
ncbi:MBL fold metallo-hydrolase [Bhargavaea beijingensis]|uniref:MBL fold metallo-hydrolase n=1 Tax=Bhargavaea beijingensis TaxID=426756 RepID=UPI0022240FF5|nr:MBL fold metallo-hydrolase [Bhargavaea beijingensis]MCW1929426.1 MBL fold metallo-hydrolase [Bhargavaea beijingensis]